MEITITETMGMLLKILIIEGELNERAIHGSMPWIRGADHALALFAEFGN